MRNRAILFLLAALSVALAAITIWVRQVAPLVEATPAVQIPPSTLAAAPPIPANQLHSLVKGTLILAFTLVGMLLLVGISAIWREWFRRPEVRPSGERTPYVDAWKLAAERLVEQDDQSAE